MKMRLNILTGLVAAAVFFSAPVWAQKPRISASADTTSGLIGDHIRLFIDVRVPFTCKTIWPKITDTLSKNIEVISRSGPDSAADRAASMMNYSDTLLLTCFDSGSFFIPPLGFIFICGAEADTSYTPAIPLYVNTVYVDTSQNMRDIKPPLRAYITLEEIIPWVLVLGGILILGGVVFFVIRKLRKKRKKSSVDVLAGMPVHEWALAEIEKLRSARLWQAGQLKQYYTRLTEILRFYIRERYRIDATEMITDEIVTEMQTILKKDGTLLQLSQILDLADRVKFARFSPLPDENDKVLRDTISFVMSTREITEAAGSAETDDNTKGEAKNSDVK